MKKRNFDRAECLNHQDFVLSSARRQILGVALADLLIAVRPILEAEPIRDGDGNIDSYSYEFGEQRIVDAYSFGQSVRFDVMSDDWLAVTFLRADGKKGCAFSWLTPHEHTRVVKLPEDSITDVSPRPAINPDVARVMLANRQLAAQMAVIQRTLRARPAQVAPPAPPAAPAPPAPPAPPAAPDNAGKAVTNEA